MFPEYEDVSYEVIDADRGKVVAAVSSREAALGVILARRKRALRRNTG
jgi:lipocalin